MDGLAVVDDSWRRLDADVIKDFLVQELVAHGDTPGGFGDVLAMRLADGAPVAPRELAGLVHTESVAILEQMRQRCLRDGENVIVEGTLAWEMAAYGLLVDLTGAGYRELHVVDVEVARERALERWWAGRNDERDALGGRWIPLDVIDRAYRGSSDERSICARNARALFVSDHAAEFELVRLTVVDQTSGSTVTRTSERRDGIFIETR